MHPAFTAWKGNSNTRFAIFEYIGGLAGGQSRGD
jgi:hypothetical protein